ncbi:uncharacterized protein BDW43DRAFT_309638 [Aspergillus alliaceus]|uniref:uncharacterized protein n=1 Tax=Petromyces alliaceus TaxID=209559 RepID=UPI0012A738F8|nr:uncharacterized protein BDW43DRAFT_309638 [Aspergillus alliaceus]KAB8235272.1 hypothetical protein BDW43DRAFT_309638 [Aspergillus alliaceus]
MPHLNKSTLCGGIAKIGAGTAATTFAVHIELLRGCSPYFDRYFGLPLDDKF